jgi:hypothetical protein
MCKSWQQQFAAPHLSVSLCLPGVVRQHELHHTNTPAAGMVPQPAAYQLQALPGLPAVGRHQVPEDVGICGPRYPTWDDQLSAA